MVTLDRIKILTDKKHIKSVDSDVATTILKSNIGKAIRYSQKKPFNIYLNYSLQDDTCIIEFSSKLLLDRYPELINRNNIHKCFEDLGSIGFCELDIDGIVHHSELLTCDVTSDISGIVQPDRLGMKSCLVNHNKFRVQKYGNNGYTVNKMVKTTNRQLRMIIYDKGKELRKKNNAEYLAMLSDADSLLSYFDGKFRVEANINTKEQIRQLFHTKTTDLLDVLNSDANPLLTLFDEVFVFPEEPEKQNQEMPSPLSHPKLKTVKNALLLQACEYDMEKVDLVLNNTLSPCTDKSKYRAELNKMLNSYPQPNKNIAVMKRVRQEIAKCINSNNNETEHLMSEIE
jgi:hypothetical protein